MYLYNRFYNTIFIYNITIKLINKYTFVFRRW